MQPLIQKFVTTVRDQHGAALDEALDESIRALTNLLHLDAYHREGHLPEQLGESFGPFGSEAFNLSALSASLNQKGSRREMPESRILRIHSLVDELETLRSFCASPPERFPDADFREPEKEIHRKADAYLQRAAHMFRSLRIAQLEITSKYREEEHGPLFEDFHWRELSAAELRLCPPFVISAEDEHCQGEGLRKIISLLESRKPFKIVALRSSLLKYYPPHSEPAVPPSLAMELIPLAMRGIAFLQTSPAVEGYEDQILRTLCSPFPGLISILAPREPESPAQYLRRAEVALRSHAFPAVAYDPDHAPCMVACLDLSGNPPANKELKISEWIISDPDVSARLRDPETPLPRESLVPIEDYLPLSRRQRKNHYPCVHVGAEAQVKLLPPELVTQITDQLHLWKSLAEVAGIDHPILKASTAALKAEMTSKKEAEMNALRAELESQRTQIERSAKASTVRQLVHSLTGEDPGILVDPHS